MPEIIYLQCPCCKENMNNQDTCLKCRQCGAVYPIYDGIPSFIKRDEFYEGKFTETEPDPSRSKGRLTSIAFNFYRAFSQSHMRNRFIARMVGKKRNNIKILDIGCGGGSSFLANMGYVVGVDISLASLRNARNIYRQVAHADISLTPFPDACFDFIVSRDILGHIPAIQKDSAYKEMFRLCRAGGKIIHVIEVKSRNPIWKFALKHTALFRKYFLDQYGHYGLEKPDKTCCRLEKAGFKPVYISPVFKTGIVRANQYIAMFDNEYRQQSKLVNFIVLIAKIINKYPIMRGAYSFLAGVLDSLVGTVLPLSWAQLLLVCYEKNV